MDHAFIDDHAVAERYVKRTLPADERVVFEAHLVDCPECADRVLLAAMLRNGRSKPVRVAPPLRASAPQPVKRSNVSSLRIWKLALWFAAAAAALLAVPTALFFWQLHRLR
jgi:anti-sigma factor RsiW